MSFSTDFAAAIDKKFRNDLALRQAREVGPRVQYERAYAFTVEEGQKFDRIVQQHDDDEQRSVHAFVERSTGKLIKASGWKAPAKRSDGELQSQFNLSTPSGFAEAVSAADKHGGYLYLR